MEDIKKMFYKYAEDEYKASLLPINDPNDQNNPVVPRRPKFRYLDGTEKLSDLPLPFLADLPNGSSEGVFLTASRNAGSGLVPILE